MNILIINAHSSKNKGDAGIILSMIDSMRKKIPDCNIKVKTRFPEIDKHAYRVNVGEAIFNINIHEKTTKLEKLILTMKMMRVLKNKSQRPIIEDEDYSWADIVVSCGGGFLLTHGFSLMTLQHLVQIKTAMDYKKPVIIYSQSIGPFYNNFISNITKKILNNVTKIFVREKISYELLKEMGVTTSIEIVPDSAFSMDSQESIYVDNLLKDIKSSNNGPLIGITVRDWNFPEVDNPSYYRDKYIKSIQEVIIYLEKINNAKVLLMPQVLGPNKFNDDRNISKEILSGIPDTEAELIDFDFHPRELKYLYSKVDMFIGTRMHSNIFALSSIIPTVAINYEHKTTGIMELLELKDHVIDINDITPEILIQMSNKCWNNREQLKSHLNERIPKVIEQAQLPAEFINQL
ncbi:polysaccharide pyruvyl transferase family protein [Metabacillus sp. FJAT-53654]|uniref:Polysaccharide pyruvyl transferase family protein n=1 Tax=Metabacillus rhizosphaerae TaxID=3117747 RepID=A0ABZ2MWL3_9BACI